MFNLEQAIADWRQKMLAAGIETPVPLEELELHLREEMERQMWAGVKEQEAFEKAVECIGDGHTLKVEFQKTSPIYWGIRRKSYDLMLAAFVFYAAFLMARMVLGTMEKHWPVYDGGTVGLPVNFGGAIASFWAQLVDNSIVHARWFGLGLALLLNFIYLSTMASTLWARRYRPRAGYRMTKGLNWALLPVLPYGTLIGFYGLLVEGLEQVSDKIGAWDGKLVAFKKSFSGKSEILRMTGGFVTCCFAEKLLLYSGIQIYNRIFEIRGYGSGHLGFPRIANSYLVVMSIGASFILGSWMLRWAWQMIRGPRARYKASRSLEIFRATVWAVFGCLLCLNGLLQLVSIDFYFTSYFGEIFSLEYRLFAPFIPLFGPSTILIICAGSFIFGAWIIRRAIQTIRGTQASTITDESHV